MSRITMDNVRSILDAKRKREEPPIIAGRPPPNDVGAEKAVIANCLQRTDGCDTSVIDRVSAVLGELGPDAFYSPTNASLWRAMTQIHASGIGVDEVTIATRMRECELWSPQAESMLREIADLQPALIDRMVIDHARIVARKARMRRVIAMLQEWAARGYGDVPDDEEYMREVSTIVGDAARETGAVEDVASAAEAEILLVAELGEARVALEQGNSAGFPTGIHTLDHAIGGLFPRKVHFISAKRKGRKSTVATWIAVSVAGSTERVIVGGETRSSHRGVVVFPLEMSKIEVQMVASCQLGNVDSSRFTKGTADACDYAAREHGASKFVHLPLVFDDRPGLSVDTLRQRVREARAKLLRGLPGRRRLRADGTYDTLAPLAPAALRLVVIDTIQLLAKRTPHRSGELQSVTDAAGAAVRAISLEPEFCRVSWLIISHENDEGRLRDSFALENHLTQWIKLDVSENTSPQANRDELVARFRVHLWRDGEEGAEASAWLNRRTGAFS